MKKLTISLLKNIEKSSDINDLSKQLDTLERHEIGYVPWAEYPYSPKVSFSISHANDCIFLKYYVTEKNIKAANYTTNSPVYEDTCVEFFISFDDKAYYNLEFNCIGTCLVAFGATKLDRIVLPNFEIDKIKYQAVIKNKENDVDICWELALLIPTSIFCHHQIDALVGTRTKGNFYKCGDKLPEPHFLAWSNIESLDPEFHLPGFFGALEFEP